MAMGKVLLCDVLFQIYMYKCEYVCLCGLKLCKTIQKLCKIDFLLLLMEEYFKSLVCDDFE